MRGSSVFNSMSHKEQIVARFLIKFFRLDENDAQDVITVRNMIKASGGV